MSTRVIPQILTLLMLVSGSVTASTPDFKDYPNAETKSAGQSEKHNYPVVTSPLKKVNGQITADEEIWLDGQLDRRWLQIPAGHDSFAAFDFYERQLYAQDIKVLFQCDRYTCGESTYWANNVFGIAGLNGYDRSQSLLVAERGAGSHRVIYTLYTVQRGNRRVQVLFDQFRPDTNNATVETAAVPSKDYVLAALDSNGFYDISDWPAMNQPFSETQSFKLLAEVIKSRPKQEWILVIQAPSRLGQNYDLEKQLNAESAWGDRIIWAIAQSGADTSKIQILPTGPAISVETGNDNVIVRLIAIHP